MIKLKGINKVYGTGSDAVHALRDVSLHVPQGKIFGVIGASGAGKSTLIRCVNLLERPTEGQVIVDGQDLVALSERDLTQARRQIGMIFQHFNLLASRTVFANMPSCWRWSGWKPVPTPIRPSSPAVRNSGSPSPGRWRRHPRCCSVTRPLRPSIRRPPARS